ncbi:aminomethyl-transferring glycine dehydrogenase [Leeia sp. TBRC 13508]|uniref:Glycine dehydrogenase (decarboxylating) n=1 Tax=Leeia speluncae TaxID=2884804 RepID=A0ABS8D2U8_9NEIS|nr:aminomethyl-transferring glycine dehydrogenase [Leeia speluncae]MCB6182534.1 aminomethyl-transferring glycine dehydrogenase [Leeia speluncae]
MPNTPLSLTELEQHDAFQRRHIGPSRNDQTAMLSELGFDSMEAFISSIVPANIRREAMPLPGPRTEAEVLAELKEIASKNQVFKSYIGMGYYGTHTPGVIQRNILENPAWYTAYTPYQPEISQGRLEAILNFQTMITDMTGMDIANSSMLDEGTAAAEAMTLAQRAGKSKSNVLYIAADVLPQTIAVVETRAKPIDVEVRIFSGNEPLENDSFAVILQYPGVNGDVRDYAEWVQSYKARGGLVIAAADLLALTLLTPPGEWGADIVIGTSQRFGVPMGFGGPHAGYMATKDEYKRQMPGRLVGVSIDSQGQPAYRLALQTREQHIRREKATSNICTAQVLLAVMASMYAVYHGPKGLKVIAQRVNRLTSILASGLKQLGFTISNDTYFDTLTVQTGARTEAIVEAAQQLRLNLRNVGADQLGISLDETTTRQDIEALWHVFAPQGADLPEITALENVTASFSDKLNRTSSYLDHPVFHLYHSETEMLRYLRRLADKDLALDRTMIPLGSCTMKLNATTEMIPVTWPEFGQLHPFAPVNQTEGYLVMIRQLEEMLAAATGYAAVSIQPNAGSQGEYAGLLIIHAYHESRGEGHRNICLIPSSAHGTNPASAQMAGMQVVVVKCDEQGNVDIADLRAKAEQHSANLAAIMITYPSTHGVFEAGVREICDIVHQHGGQVYVDGANMNAQVGLSGPGLFGGDVSHLNLHKTFCIPHGGGGPGVGPVAVGGHLAKFLPGHPTLDNSASNIGPISAAPFGSASILPISWAYIRMMGGDGLTYATQNAILAANYVAKKLAPYYPVLYSGPGGLIAHECILDLRPIKDSSGISVDDVAKRLMDFGFHAPTMSFPVAGTLMVEPTESESIEELDRFIEAMIAIREEIQAVEDGKLPKDNNPLVHAPHTAEVVLSDAWDRPYAREQAAYPVKRLRQQKYWPPVGRVDNVYGDRNLFCSCIPMSDYE